MKANDIKKARDPLLQLALPALQRAARNARKQAIIHNTQLVYWKNNRVIKLSPDEIHESLSDYKIDK
ncbi:MAG: hypothetical protein V3V12_05335 [Gammaproteobacteria bacterium]